MVFQPMYIIVIAISISSSSQVVKNCSYPVALQSNFTFWLALSWYHSPTSFSPPPTPPSLSPSLFCNQIDFLWHPQMKEHAGFTFHDILSLAANDRSEGYWLSEPGLGFKSQRRHFGTRRWLEEREIKLLFV